MAAFEEFVHVEHSSALSFEQLAGKLCGVNAVRTRAFWNTGDESLLKAAISPNFTDHTLPPGRPQGPQGPAFASEHFRAAAPDLTVEIRKMVVADDYVTVHMEFKGHFTGAFGKAKGQGQSIDFVATDLLKIADGRVTDNWHIEDNLTLISQMGVAKIEQ